MTDDAVSKALAEAQRAAGQMTPESVDPEAIRDRAAKKFFGENGIPPELAKGWAIYQQRIKQREMIGTPLPPGGCLLLGIESVLAGALAEMHVVLMALLQVPREAIQLRLQRQKDGSITPVADIALPDNIVVPVIGNQGPEEATQVYLESVLRRASQHFKVKVTERLAQVGHKREDLVQKIKPWVPNEQQG